MPNPRTMNDAVYFKTYCIQKADLDRGKPNLNQLKNAFFIQRYLKNIPASAMKDTAPLQGSTPDLYESDYHEEMENIQYFLNDREMGELNLQ